MNKEAIQNLLDQLTKLNETDSIDHFAVIGTTKDGKILAATIVGAETSVEAFLGNFDVAHSDLRNFLSTRRAKVREFEEEIARRTAAQAQQAAAE